MSRAATSTARSTSPKKTKAVGGGGGAGGASNRSTGYLSISQRPLASLLFLLPLMIAYELGTLLFARDFATGTETSVLAFDKIIDFFALFGTSGRFLPPLLVSAVLFTTHLFHKDAWHIPRGTFATMFAESVCWAIPLLAIGVLIAPFLPNHINLFSGPESLAAKIALSLGAGIYEEMLFRYIAFAFLSFFLTDLFDIAPRPAAVITLLTTSVLFSLYHYLGYESFHWRSFVARTVAGLFFGGIYLRRGFGITAGSHAAYDVIVHLLQA